MPVRGGVPEVGHAPGSAEPEARGPASPRRIEGREPAPPEVAALFRVPGLWLDVRGVAMEGPELEAISDDAMDSFLEKFQSQPYRGGFNEDQWEEVGRPRALHVRGASCELGLQARRHLSQSPDPWRCQQIGDFYLSVKSQPQGFQGLLSMPVHLGILVLRSDGSVTPSLIGPDTGVSYFL